MANRTVRYRGICHPPASPENYDGYLLRISDMKKQLDKMEGAPLMVDHGDEEGEFYQCYKNDAIGTVLKGWIDEKNRLIVEFETDRSNPLGARAEKDIKSGTLTSLSLGIGHVIGQNIKDPLDFRVIAKDIHEVSATKDPAQDTLIYGVQPDSKDWKIKTNLIQKHLTDVKYQRSVRQKGRGNMGDADASPNTGDERPLIPTDNPTSPDTGRERERENPSTKRSRDESPSPSGTSGENVSATEIEEFLKSRPDFQQFMDEKKKKQDEEEHKREEVEKEERDYYKKKAPDMVNYLAALGDLGKDEPEGAGKFNRLMENYPEILEDWKKIVETAPQSEDWKTYRPMLSVLSQASEHAKATIDKVEGACQEMKKKNEEYKKQLEEQDVESKKRRTTRDLIDRWDGGGGTKTSKTSKNSKNNPYDVRLLSQRLGTDGGDNFDRRWPDTPEGGSSRSSQSASSQPPPPSSSPPSDDSNLDMHPATRALLNLFGGKTPEPLTGGEGRLYSQPGRQIPRMSTSSLRQADVSAADYYDV